MILGPEDDCTAEFRDVIFMYDILNLNLLISSFIKKLKKYFTHKLSRFKKMTG